MAALGPAGQERVRPSARVVSCRRRRCPRARCWVLGLVVGCTNTPPPRVAAPQTYTPGLYAVFPAPARHRDEGSEHHWELCYKGAFYHLMCSAAWSGGLADEMLDAEFQEYGPEISVLIDRTEEIDGLAGRRVRYVSGHRVYDWLFVTTEESTFMMSYEGPNTERSRSHGEFFMKTFHLEPGAECPSVEHARYDDTKPRAPRTICPGMPRDPKRE